jgi:ribosome-binding ATPase YchF (GTP1/OBG family)
MQRPNAVVVVDTSSARAVQRCCFRTGRRYILYIERATLYIINVERDRAKTKKEHTNKQQQAQYKDINTVVSAQAGEAQKQRERAPETPPRRQQQLQEAVRDLVANSMGQKHLLFKVLSLLASLVHKHKY